MNPSLSSHQRNSGELRLIVLALAGECRRDRRMLTREVARRCRGFRPPRTRRVTKTIHALLAERPLMGRSSRVAASGPSRDALAAEVKERLDALLAELQAAGEPDVP